MNLPPSAPLRLCGESLAPRGESVPPNRFDGVDILKAFAILSVVWIHAHDTLSGTTNIPVQITRSFSHFVVASFLFASGFLHWSATPLAWPTVRRRLLRVLVPYLVASVCAVAVSAWYSGQLPTAAAVAFQLLTGSAFGFYHFVPLLCVAVALSFFLSRSRRLAHWALLATLIAGLLTAQGIIDVGVFWYPRHPIRWWVYYLFGWEARAYWTQMASLDATTGRRLAVALAGLGVALTMSGSWFLSSTTPRLVWGALIYLGSLCWIGGLTLSVRRGRSNRLVQFLSDATYPVYLYHYFFVVPVWIWLGRVGSLRTTIIAYIAGWIGSLLIIVIGRRLLGERARLLLGA